MIQKINQISNGVKNGFTIIEMVVAVAVFALLVGASSGIFVSSLKSQRQSLATGELLNQTSYLMEYMSRAVRMAEKDLTGLCLTTAGAKYNYETNPAKDRLRFLNYLNKCQEFFLDSGRIKERKSTNSSAANFQTSQDLTSASSTVSLFNVVITGAQQLPTDVLQPKVTVFLKIAGGEGSKIAIQTSISQRNPDVRK